MPESMLKVFISSTSVDLPEYREAVREAILNVNMFPNSMENWAVQDINSIDLCRQKLEESDIYIGVFAYRYGWRPKGKLKGKSITEMEYDWAETKGIPRLCFIMDDNHPWPENLRDINTADIKAQKAFKERIKLRIMGRFTSTDNLKSQVTTALYKEISLISLSHNSNTLTTPSTNQSRPSKLPNPNGYIGQVIIGLVVAILGGVILAYLLKQNPFIEETPIAEKTDILLPSPAASMTSIVLTTQSIVITHNPIMTPAIFYEPTPTSILPIPPNMIYIPPGSYQLNDGSSIIVPAFAIDRTEETQDDFYTFAIDPSSTSGDDRIRLLTNTQENNPKPVIYVTWEEARDYCQSRGEGYDLPTLSEWRVAAYWNPVENQVQLYPWGNEVSWTANLNNEHDSPLLPQTYPANAWGAYDIAGNVAEWVREDNGIQRNVYRVMGGDYQSSITEVGLNVMGREYDTPYPRNDFNRVGFRCAFYPKP